MATGFDASAFVDRASEAAQTSFLSATTMIAQPAYTGRARTRDEVDSKVGEHESKLSEQKRAQTELERERASLEETRRRQTEFTTGREEVIHTMTRGLTL